MNIRALEIYPVLNGFVVKAGCQLLAYTDREKMKSDFAAYVDDPQSMEKRMVELEGFNRKTTLGPTPGPELCPPQTCESSPSQGNSLVNALRR